MDVQVDVDVPKKVDVKKDVDVPSVGLDVPGKCYATEDGMCSNHNTRLERRKQRKKYWGETKDGTRRWKYKLEEFLLCGCSNFKALPYPTSGEGNIVESTD